MTDNEIIKALKSCGNHLDCVDCECVDNCPQDINELNGLTFDLINRLQAQNKDLAETVHNLTIEKDALFDKVEELKAEIERLKTNLNVELENFATEYDDKIKAEAIKEFAEKLRADWLFGGKDGKPYRETIDNLVKEMVGEEK